MADLGDYADLFAIDIGVDTYAETAAADVPDVSRTSQSDEQFQEIKASYMAKIDTGNNYRALLRAIPTLEPQTPEHQDGNQSKAKLGNKDKNLLGYAVGEMYYDREFSKVIDLCRRVELVCAVDTKLRESLRKWTGMCEAKMQNGNAV